MTSRTNRTNRKKGQTEKMNTLDKQDIFKKRQTEPIGKIGNPGQIEQRGETEHMR